MVERSFQLRNPCRLGVSKEGRHLYGYTNHIFSAVSDGKKCLWRYNPCLLGVPIAGESLYDCINPAFSGGPS